MIGILKRFIRIVNVLGIIVLLILHFIIKDNSLYSSFFFYALPLPIITSIVLFFSVFLSKKMRKYNLLLAFLLLVIWLGRSFKIHIPEDIKESDLEIVFWNVSRDNNFEDAFKKNGGIPDLMVLAESRKNDIEMFKQKYPNYYFYKSDRELFIFSKTPIERTRENTSKHGSTVISFKTANINFYAIDVQGSPDVPREWELRYVNESIQKTESTIVLGDFNTPYESMHLKQFKKNFNQAFNEKGNGFRETWFYNIPYLSLDHIWVSKDLKVLKTKKFYTTESDHSMLKTFIKR